MERECISFYFYVAWADLKGKRWFQTLNPIFLREHASVWGKVGETGVSCGKVDTPDKGSAVGTVAKEKWWWYKEVILVP